MSEFNPVLRYEQSKNKTRKAAINAMCAHCMGCTSKSIERGFASNIKHCSVQNCPLYVFRPYQQKERENQDGKAQ